MRRWGYLFILLLLTGELQAQGWKINRLEVHLGLPINHYFGDIGSTSGANIFTSVQDVRIRALRSGIGGGIGYRVQSFLTAQTTLNVGFWGNTDEGTDFTNRGYRFSTFGTELLVKGLYYIIPESNQNYCYSIMNLRGGLRHLNKPYSFYVFLGAGGLFFSSSANETLLSRTAPPGVTKKEVDESKNFTFVIPFGIGVKYEFYPRFHLGFEVGARFVTTDYLDAFSSAYSKHNDMYYTVNLNLYYKVPYHKLLKKSFLGF